MLTLLLALSSLPSAQAQDTGAPAEELPPIVKMPELVEFVQAPYPPEAEALGLEADVLLLIEIDETGVVTSAEVLQPAGSGFDEAALEAVQQMRFSPAEDTTGPVPVAIEFAYGFELAPEEPAPDAPPEPLPINVEGVLKEMGTKRLLSGVQVAVEGTGITAETDTEGRFALRGVPTGQATIIARHPGYDDARTTVDITEGEALSFTLWIRNQSYRTDELVGVYQKERTEVTRRSLSVEEVRRIPGTFGDPVRVIQNLPGAARSPFGSGLLVIRGANPEDSGVYIDGVRIPLIYHLGGYASVINPDLIAGVDYLPGNYGVQYGRTLGGVIDVTTKTEWSENPRFTWSTDVLDSGGFYERRIGKKHNWGIAAGARRSYIDAFIPLFTKNTPFTVKPRWYDYQFKVQSLGDGPDKASLFVFGFQDILRASSAAGFAQGTDQDTQGDLGTAYDTHRALIRYDRKLSETLDFTFIPSFGVDTSDFTLGNDTNIEIVQALYILRSELGWSPSPALRVVPGIDAIAIKYRFTFEFPFDPTAFAEYDPLEEREPFALDDTGWVWAPDPFLDLEWRPFEDRERLLLKPGIRYSYADVRGQYIASAFDPRLATRVKVLDGGFFKGGAGIYTQPPQPFESLRPDGGGVDLGFERALSTEVGFEQQLTQGLHADIAFFYKRLDDLIVDNPDLQGIDDPYFFNDGIGRVRGMEVMVRQAAVGRFFGWVSYTLSHSERKDRPSEDWYDYELDQTHILVALGSYKLPRDFGVSGKVQYVTGNPYTPYSGGVYDVDQDSYFPFSTAGRNSERLPEFVAVDFRVDKLWTFKTLQLETYIDFINAIRGVNPEFVLDNYDYTEDRYIRGLPFIPSPGVQLELTL